MTEHTVGMTVDDGLLLLGLAMHEPDRSDAEHVALCRLAGALDRVAGGGLMRSVHLVNATRRDAWREPVAAPDPGVLVARAAAVDNCAGVLVHYLRLIGSACDLRLPEVDAEVRDAVAAIVDAP